MPDECPICERSDATIDRPGDSESERIDEARRKLSVARNQWEDADTAMWEPTDPAECVGKCFYAFENAVVAAATALGRSWEKNHRHKALLAGSLFDDGKVTKNIHDTLVKLNDVRKDIVYGEPGLMIEEIDLKNLVSELDEYLIQIEQLVDPVEESD